MFWNVTFIYNAFIRTTDHCKVQTAFVSLCTGYPSASKKLPGYPMGTRASPTLGHLTNFCTNFYEFFYFGKFVKIREFFAEVTNSRSMVAGMRTCCPVPLRYNAPAAYPRGIKGQYPKIDIYWGIFL